MRRFTPAALAVALAPLLGAPATAQAPAQAPAHHAPGAPAPGAPAGLARPHLVHKEVVTGMPRGERQEVQVLTASFAPGDRTVFHDHRFPVAVHVLEGAFTLEMEGRAPVVLRAGEAMVEPPNVRMTGYNRSAGERLRVIIFYVGDPGAPFLDVAH